MSPATLRTKILGLLSKHREGLTLARIQSEFEVKRRDRAKLLEELRDLERSRLVCRLKSRFLLAPKSGLIRGRFVTSRRGFGFVSPSEGGEDIFIPGRFASGVLEGDEVEVLVKEEGRFGKPEGRVVRVLKQGSTTFLGVYKERFGAPF